MRTKQHSVSARMIAVQSSASRRHRSGSRPSVVVTACQVWPFPSCESVRSFRLVPPGTTASADSCSRTTAIPGHRSHRCRWAGRQVSLSKNVNSGCTTGPFISGAECRAALCGASSPSPSTLYGLSVRRLISFDLQLPSHGTSRFRSCLGLMFGPSCPSL